MRTLWVIEKFVRLLKDMLSTGAGNSMTVVSCAVGVTDAFKVWVGLLQGSPLSPFFFTVVMDRLTDEARQESLWTVMFTDDIVICC